jgi:hypothetical protein
MTELQLPQGTLDRAILRAVSLGPLLSPSSHWGVGTIQGACATVA